MHYEELAEKVRYFKEDEKGVQAMCKAIEDMRNETAKQIKVNDIRNVMEAFGVSVEKAMESLKIPRAQWAGYLSLLGK